MRFQEVNTTSFNIGTDVRDDCFFIAGSSFTNDRFFAVKSTGNVGIGTTNPSAALHVESDGQFKLRDTRTYSSTIGPVIFLQGRNSDGNIKNFATINARSSGIDTGDLAFNVRKSNSLPDEEVMRIKSSGNVGIGTTAPSTKLVVKGDQANEAQITIAADNTAGPKDAILYLNASRGTGNQGSNATITATHDGASALAKMLFATRRGNNLTPETAMTIDSSGNVGIGTDDPSAKLEVVETSSDVQLEVRGTSSAGGKFQVANAGGDLYANLRAAGSSDDAIKLDTNGPSFFNGGNVGIGTTSPSGILDVVSAGQGDATQYLRNDTVTLKSVCGQSSAVIGTDTNHQLSFAVGGTVVAGINTAGNVGIGTTNPFRNLTVAGNFRLQKTNVDGSTTGLDFNVGGGADNPELNVYDKDGNAGVFTIKNLKVGIGTTNPANTFHSYADTARQGTFAARIDHASTGTSAASHPFGLSIRYTGASPDVNTGADFLRCQDSTAIRMRVFGDGDVLTSDHGTLSSDRNLKTNIVDATPKLQDIKKLKVRNFEWIPEYHPAKQGEKKIGFIAQEMEEVFPGLVQEQEMEVEGKSSTSKSVRIGALIPILVKGMQEQQDIIEQLKNQNALLESRISALES